MSSRKKKRQTIWRDENFIHRCRQLIEEGVLHREDGLVRIMDTLNEEFFAEEKYGEKLTKRIMRARLDDVVWTKHALSLLKGFVREGQALDEVYERLSYIPRSMVDKKAKQLRGRTPKGEGKYSTIFEAGYGRLVTDEEVKRVQRQGLPDPETYGLSNPFEIRVADENKYKVMIINGPHLGLEYNRVLDENVLRNAFRHARRVGVDAVIITAGLMWMDMKKSAGRLTTHRALYYGLDFDPDVLDPGYRDEAVRIRKELPADEISFETLRERVMNALGGWSKVTRRKNGDPIVNCPIYFSFGYPEEEMIERAAHEHLRYLKDNMRASAMAERKAYQQLLKYELAENGETEEAQRLRKEVAEALRREKRKSPNTNISKQDSLRFVSVVRELLISWYKRALPNAEFIGQGSTVLKLGDQLVEISQAGRESPTERIITGLIKSIGQRDLEGTLPNLILGAGAYNMNYRWAARECMRGTQMDQVHLVQLPVLIDRDYIRGAKSELIRKSSPMEKLLDSANFEPGTLILSRTDGLWDYSPVPVSMLTQRHPKAQQRKRHPKEIYIYAEGDQHAGNSSKEYVYDQATGQMLPMEVAASTIFMREFVEKDRPLPFHFFSSHGDSTQGRHFQTERNRHPLHEPAGKFEVESAEFLRKLHAGELTPEQVKRESAGILQRLNQQLRLRGEHYYQQQVEEFAIFSVEARTRFFLEILKRGRSADMSFRGINEVLSGIENAPDRRNIGLLNFLDGNHGEKTTDGTFTEGWVFARIALLSILAERDNPFSKDELERLVRSPVWGPVASGYGLVSVEGKYEWGLHLRHDPTRKSGQDGDPLARATKNMAERGDYGLIFNGRDFITIVGDQHRYAAAYAPGKVVFQCACGTHGDSYGDDWGFSRSNLGGLIIAVPVDGPGAGPVRMIPISHVFIRRYMENPWNIDWKRLFPNPA